MGNCKNLDQFFTKEDVSKECVKSTISILNQFDIDIDNSLFVEPSAGYGCFLDNIQEKGMSIKGYDIDPKRRDVIKNDFLKQDLNFNDKKVVIIGNPPFGSKGKTALDFIKKALEYGDFVCFILPNNFQKYSMQRLLPQEIRIVYQRKLPKNSFYIVRERKREVDIGCIFQILTKKNGNKDLRIRKKPDISHNDFFLYQYNNTPQALRYFDNDFDIAVFNQGYGKYPTIKTKAEDCNKRKQWLLIKAKNNTILSNIKKMDFKKLADNNTTVKGFRKADFVAEYKRLYD